MEVKTLDDYKYKVKQLKLKIMKLQKKNEDLQIKLQQPMTEDELKNMDQMKEAISLNNYATRIQSVWRGKKDRRLIEIKVMEKQKQGDTKFNMNSNDFVMQLLAESAQKMGLTPEMLFRAADKKQTNTLLVDEFKQFLQKIKLGLSQAQIARVVFLCDEDCSGVIRKDEYMNCLQAYGINREQNKQNTRTFGQQCLIKYGKLLLQKKINAEKSYRVIDPEFKDYITCKEFSDYVDKISAGDELTSMTDKEIVSLFNFMDQEKASKVIKDVYIQKINQALRVAAQETGQQLSRAFQQQQDEGDQIPEQKQETQKQTKKQQQQQQNEPLHDISKITLPLVGPDFVKALEQKKFSFEELINNLIYILGYSTSKVKIGGVLKDLSQACDKLDVKLNKSEQISLFRVINTDGNGFLDYDEIGSFYSKFKDKKPDFRYIYELYKLKIQSRNQDLLENIIAVDPQNPDFQYLADNADKIISRSDFNKIATKLFWIDNNTYKSWMYDDIKDKDDDNVYFHSIKKMVYMYDRNKENQGISSQVQIQTDTVLKKGVAALDVNLKNIESSLYALKPEITSKDKFNKKKIEENKDTEYKSEWNTIFNNELACLVYAFNVVKQLEKSGEKKWVDPEFGSNQFDKYGSSSLYISDNDIPPGCPIPEDVKWLNPEEILQERFDMGQDEYQGQDCVFLKDGAESNDVKQSQYLGDCYFISALSLIAADDKYIIGNFNPNNAIDDAQVKGFSEGLWPPMFHFLSKYGIYVIRFFKNYKWRYVMVDDRLPCKEQGEIIYAQCKQINELWVSIIEKAYAKIHNNYQALISGDIAQALSDMTGMVADKTKLVTSKYTVNRLKVQEQVLEEYSKEIQNIQDQSKQDEFIKQKVEEDYRYQKKEQQNDVDELWKILVESKERGTLMGCSADGETEGFIEIDDQSTGIMSGHAYSIIDVFELPYNQKELNLITKGQKRKNYHANHRLVRIRNPWGYGEWQLGWSEKEYAEKEGKLYEHMDQIKIYYDKEIERFKTELRREPPERYEEGDDGTFLMCFKDWRMVFSNLFQCINFPDDYKGFRFIENWQEGYNYGVPKKSQESQKRFAMENHQYIIRVDRAVEQQAKIYISLGQGEGRLYNGEKYPFERVTNSVLLLVFKLKPGEEYLEQFDKESMVASSDKLNLRREVDSGEIILKNGVYSVMPVTKKQGDIGMFSLNIYYNNEKEKGVTFSKLYGQVGNKKIVPIDENNDEFWIKEEEEDTDHNSNSKEFIEQLLESTKK